MTEDVEVSKHANERIRERCGINKKSVDRMVNIVLENGISHSEAKGNLKKWIDGQYLKYKKASKLIVYGDKLYIFSGNVLVTVIQVPNNLLKIVKKIMEEKEKNAND